MGIQGGYTGWVYRRAIPGTTQPPRKEPYDSEAGPVRPYRGLEWVVIWRVRAPAAGRLQNPPLRGPVGLQPPWFWTLANAASWPIRARFHAFFHKVSQNR